MRNIIPFPRLKEQQIVQIKVNNELYLGRIIEYVEDNIYKIKIIEGNTKGYYGYFKACDIELI